MKSETIAFTAPTFQKLCCSPRNWSRKVSFENDYFCIQGTQRGGRATGNYTGINGRKLKHVDAMDFDSWLKAGMSEKSKDFWIISWPVLNPTGCWGVL